ncbi:MAG: ribulose-phosphate 3-epimerase, partial [Halobacteriovoraceae bacterium]|nr:ribulose-phosphate 3-epimerase [Halobacteriovoraceae bacterium]
ATENPLALIKEAKKYFPSVGISIKPGTPIENLSDEVLYSIDLLLVMSVEPGFGGQSFIEETYGRLNQISSKKEALGLNFEIQIDGGVSDSNSQKLLSHGATNLVAGSYIFKAGPAEYQKRVESLRG